MSLPSSDVTEPHLPAHKSDCLLQDASLVFIASLIGGVLNLLFQLTMVRRLSPADFGLFNSLVILTMNITVLAGPFQTVTAKYIAGYRAHHDWEKINQFIRVFGTHVLIFSGIAVGGIAAGSRLIIHLLKLPYNPDSIQLVLLAAVSIIGATAMPFLLGGLQGLQKFRSLSAATILGGGLRLGCGMVFVSWGWRVAGAMTGVVLASLLTAIYALQPLWRYFNGFSASGGTARIPVRPVYIFMAPAMLGLQSFLFLTSIDMLFVRHYFPADQAGIYAIAQMVGKIIFFLPSSLSMVLLPKLVDNHTRGVSTHTLLIKAVAMVTTVCCAAAGVTLLFPDPVLRLLAGRVEPQAVPLLLPFCMAMTFFAINQMFLYYYLARSDMKRVMMFFAAMVVQAGAFSLFHASLLQIVQVMMVCSGLLCMVNFPLLYAPGEQKSA